MSRVPPEQYRSVVERPADFDAFWADVLAQAARIPLNATAEPLPLRSTPEVETFEVHYDSLDGVRIAGWYCVPRAGVGQVGTLPAILSVPGYISDPPIPRAWARRGYAVFSVAPRGKVRSNRQFNPGYPGLLTHNLVDRNTYSYRGFYIDAARGVDFLLSRPEVDAARIGVTGSSQGGALTLTTAALRPEIRAAAAGAPYLCGFLDSIALTDAYPYFEIDDYLRLYPERAAAVRETLAYFDGINFAPRITCPILVNVGLQDNVCPPETGYAMFAGLASREKELCAYDGYGHDAGSPVHNAKVQAFFEKHLLGTAGEGGGRLQGGPADREQVTASSGRSPSALHSPAFEPAASPPPDFDAYWDAVLRELASLPVAPEEELLPIRSTEYCTCYAVRFTSIGPYRLFGYLSIPRGEGPFPTLISLPRYQSVVEVLTQGDSNAKRGRFVTFALAARGQRNADSPYAASFPGWLSDGIDDPATYVFRGVIADCCRAVDYLFARPEVDRSRLAAVVANELPILTAALRPEITHIVASPSAFYAPHRHGLVEDIADYLRLYPDRLPGIRRTLSYFDPLFFAPRVRARALLWGGPTEQPLADALAGPVDLRASESSRYKDGVYQEQWLARELGFADAIVPAHWR
jgi:cephalosporin-C deacetylase